MIIINLNRSRVHTRKSIRFRSRLKYFCLSLFVFVCAVCFSAPIHTRGGFSMLWDQDLLLKNYVKIKKKLLNIYFWLSIILLLRLKSVGLMNLMLFLFFLIYQGSINSRRLREKWRRFVYHLTSWKLLRVQHRGSQPEHEFREVRLGARDVSKRIPFRSVTQQIKKIIIHVVLMAVILTTNFNSIQFNQFHSIYFHLNSTKYKIQSTHYKTNDLLRACAKQNDWYKLLKKSFAIQVWFIIYHFIFCFQH